MNKDVVKFIVVLGQATGREMNGYQSSVISPSLVTMPDLHGWRLISLQIWGLITEKFPNCLSLD